MKPLDALIGVLTAVIGVAIVAVIVSKNAQTGSVIQAAGSAFGSILGVALSPVTGAAASTSSSTSNVLSAATGGLANLNGAGTAITGLLGAI